MHDTSSGSHDFITGLEQDHLGAGTLPQEIKASVESIKITDVLGTGLRNPNGLEFHQTENYIEQCARG